MIQLILSITLVCSNVIIIDLMLVMILFLSIMCRHYHIITQYLTMVLERNYDPVDLVYYFSV